MPKVMQLNKITSIDIRSNHVLMAKSIVIKMQLRKTPKTGNNKNNNKVYRLPTKRTTSQADGGHTDERKDEHTCCCGCMLPCPYTFLGYSSMVSKVS